jgi:NAD(P)-dependent dehydrogenase (short-subunit alcohol dehydrogenase family)
MKQIKIALVTGGSRGIGKDTALRLADKGLDVMLTYSSSEKEAEEVVKEIESRGRKAKALQMDSNKPLATFEGFVTAASNYLMETYGVAKFCCSN